MTGIGAFIVGAGFGYSGFVYLKNRFPFPPKFNIVFATASGVLLGYFVSRITSKQCQIMWTEIAVMKNKPTQTSDSMQKPSEGALPVDGEQMVQKNIYGDYMGKPVT
ncbi:transmembrane protein 141-like [Saccoglossus kowalevskii]